MNRIVATLLLFLMFVPVVSGTTPSEIIDSVRGKVAPDLRQAVFDVRAVGIYPAMDIVGTVSEDSLKRAVMNAFAGSGYCKVRDNIAVLDNIDYWGLVKIPVASLRTGPGHAREMATQAVMGTPLRILEATGEWYRVQTPDGYIAYIPSSSVEIRDNAGMNTWRNQPRLVVTSLKEADVCSTEKSVSGRDGIVARLVNGSIVNGSLKGKSKMVEVTLPDGRSGWIDRNAVSSIDGWAAQAFDVDRILDTAYSMMGAPYLWGGTSTKAPDCSGLVKVSYFSNGIILMRDASQQAKTGKNMPPEDWRSLRAGDLLFFGNPVTGRVTHVAIYDRDGRYIHSSGQVRVNSIDPDSEIYLGKSYNHLSSTRIDGQEGTMGITRAAEHPWYFNK